MFRTNGKSHFVFIIGILAVVTLAVFWRLLDSGFIFLDDPVYVSINPQVQAGLSWAGVKYAFQSIVCGNWHPLTILSHMLDCQIFGVKPGLHHLTNLLFHIANSCLVFVWLRRLTGAVWKSALVAALFAWHPLHVESVAWISERKDVLSTFFWLLSLIAYSEYLRKSKVYYFLTLLLFILGLLSKPMVVTLPFVLLLLDFWNAESTQAVPILKLPWKRFTIEKIPFFILAGVFCFVTVRVQAHDGAVQSFDVLLLGDRVANAVVSYLRYLGKTICPVDLGIFYPSPKAWPEWEVAGAVILLAAVSWLVIRSLRQRPWLAVGWFWFLGTLVPVIGLVQVGRQSMADRYAYVPSIGLFIMLAWGLDEWARQTKRIRVAATLAGLFAAACLPVTWVQAGYWKNSETLFTHDIKIVGYNYLICRDLAAYLMSQGRPEESLFQLDEALKDSPSDEPRLRPLYAQAHLDLGNNLLDEGTLALANEHFLKVASYAPDNAQAYLGLGKVLVKEQKFPEAIQQFRTAAGLQADWSDPHTQMAAVLAQQGDLPGAEREAEAAVKADPHNPDAQIQLAAWLSQQQKTVEAISHYQAGIRLYREVLGKAPDSPELLNNLAWLLATNPNAEVRNGADAVKFARHACEATKWKQPMFIGTLAAAYAEARQFAEATKTAQQARDLALTSGQPEIAARNSELLKLYEAGRAYRE